MCINQHSTKKRFSRKLTGGAPTAVAVSRCMTDIPARTHATQMIITYLLLTVYWKSNEFCPRNVLWWQWPVTYFGYHETTQKFGFNITIQACDRNSITAV